MREDAIRVVQIEEVDDPNGRKPPPIWVVVVVVAVVTGGWLLATQGSTDTDPVTNSTLLPATPDEASVVAPTVAPNEASVVTTPTVADPVSVFGNPPGSVIAETPQQLAGYVGVTSPADPPFNQSTVWVFRPGGSLVSRSDAPISRFAAEYPMLITAGHLIVGNQIFDIDLAEPPISLWTDASVYPGSGPGVVWLARRQSSSGFSASDWVSPVDVESLTVGEQVDLTDVAVFPVLGVADGLIVIDLMDESHRLWSPTDGLVDVGLPDELNAVVAASGNVVVVVTSGGVNVLDIVSGEQVVSLLVDFAAPVMSACLSPDRQHVIVVAVNGDAAVGNTATGEVISLNDDGVWVQPWQGIGWTTDDQIVFIARDGDTEHVFGFDISNGESFVIAELDGPREWWMTASGAMC